MASDESKAADGRTRVLITGGAWQGRELSRTPLSHAALG